MMIPEDELLFALAFDHRNSLLTTFFGIHRPPTPQEQDRCRQAKRIIFDGLCHAVDDGLPGGRPAVLVDEQFGGSVIADAHKTKIVTIVPFEVSGQMELAFEHGDDGVRAALARIRPDYAKILIRYHPDGDAAGNRRQRERLCVFQEHAAAVQIPWMLELLVPPLERPASAEAKHHYDRTERSDATVAAIDALTSVQIAPDLWKLEGMDTDEAFRAVAVACHAGRDDTRCLVLGRGADRAAVDRWLQHAAPIDRFAGFAVGRTTWWEPLRSFYDGAQNAESAAVQIAANYTQLITTYLAARRGR